MSNTPLEHDPDLKAELEAIAESSTPFGEDTVQRLQIFLYFIPVLGFFPALWTLYQRQGSRRQQVAGRASVIISLTWVMGYLLLSAGSSVETLSLSLMIANAVLTSGYFAVNFWLMVRIWQRKSVWLPRIGEIGDRLP
jgi:hypothetical protein